MHNKSYKKRLTFCFVFYYIKYMFYTHHPGNLQHEEGAQPSFTLTLKAKAKVVVTVVKVVKLSLYICLGVKRKIRTLHTRITTTKMCTCTQSLAPHPLFIRDRHRVHRLGHHGVGHGRSEASVVGDGH